MVAARHRKIRSVYQEKVLAYLRDHFTEEFVAPTSALILAAIPISHSALSESLRLLENKEYIRRTKTKDVARGGRALTVTAVKMQSGDWIELPLSMDLF